MDTMKAKPKAEIDKLMNNWKEAFRVANDKLPPRIYYESGWFHFESFRGPVRAKQLVEMTERLKARKTDEAHLSNRAG